MNLIKKPSKIITFEKLVKKTVRVDGQRIVDSWNDSQMTQHAE